MPPDVSTPAASSDTQSGAHFLLDRLVVRRVRFNEIKRTKTPDPSEKRPAKVPYELTLQGAIKSGRTNDGRYQAVVTLLAIVTPDQKWQPYEIEVGVSGAFAGIGVSEEVFDQFCRVGVPPILFPWVRELVHRVTTDASFGPVLLNPVNLSQLAEQAEWTTVASEANDIGQSVQGTRPSPQG